MESKSPSWLQELLDQEESVEQQRALEMNKVNADRALAAIAFLEEQQDELDSIAEQETNLIESWRGLESSKIQKKISWLVWNLSNYMKALGEKTVTLVHGQMKQRLGRQKLEVVDLEAFLPVGKRLGLLRHIEERFEPDLNAIHEYIKIHRKPPAGVLLTPAVQRFSYNTFRKGKNNDDNNNEEREQAEADSSAGPASEVEALEK
jgi:phage host-nuclease inhibitor protein Gam